LTLWAALTSKDPLRSRTSNFLLCPSSSGPILSEGWRDAATYSSEGWRIIGTNVLNRSALGPVGRDLSVTVEVDVDVGVDALGGIRSALGPVGAFGGDDDGGGGIASMSGSIAVTEYVDGWVEYGAREEEA
jgi:hypothetical protein